MAASRMVRMTSNKPITQAIRGVQSMTKSRRIIAAKIVTVLSVIPAAILANSGGALPRHTGAPGDTTCMDCHTGGAGGGNVAITYSGGASYTPGQRGTFTVTITDAAARRWGFQASARLASNASNGQAGTLHSTSTQTQVICESGGSLPCSASAPVQFVTHASGGTSANRFEFDWTPPAEAAGDVRVYVAGNAANANGQPTGDSIYTSSLTLTAAAGEPGNRPSISEGGVADAFTYQRGVAAGAWTAIFGQNLATNTRNWDGSPEFAQNKLPLALDGVSVTINGRPAPVFFISPGQVNVLAPSDDSTGNVQVVVKNAAGESTPLSVSKSRLLPALYSPFGQNQRLFVTGVENASGAILGKAGVEPRATRAFRPGDVVQFYATGLGATNPARPADEVVPAPTPLVDTPVVRINNVPVQVLGAALVGSGLYQINATIPDVPNGDHPIVVEIGGASSSNTVSISIQR